MAALFSFLHRQHAFALDLSDNAISLLETHGGLRPHVAAWSRVELPAGILEDGLILDQEKLAEAIRRAMDEATPAPPATKQVVAELPESRTFVHHFTIERDVDVKEFPDIVLARAEDTLPVNLEEYVWDYEILAQSDAGYEVLFAAAPVELVQTYEQTLALAGLKLEVLELESMALMRAALKSGIPAPAEAVALMDLGGRVTTIAVVDAAGLRLSVTIPVAGDALTAGISKKLKLKPEEAEKRKRAKGFKDADVAKAMESVLAPLIEEFSAARLFYETRYPQKLTRVLIAGGSSALPGIGDVLARQLGVPVELASSPFEIPNVSSSQTMVVSGIALRAAKLSPGLSFIMGA